MILSSDLDRRPRKFPCKDGAACKFLSLPLGCRLVFAAAMDLFQQKKYVVKYQNFSMVIVSYEFAEQQV